jgi:outer membrane protein OmpA-like peptidoglycan-associated protein
MRPVRRLPLLLAFAVLLAAQAPPPEALPPDARFGLIPIGFSGHQIGFGTQQIRFAVFRIAAPETRGGETRFRLTADVLFDFDRAELRPQAQGVLQDVARQIGQGTPRASVRIEGHTDALGTDAYNDALSLRRAESVRAFLAGLAELRGAQVQAQGLGKRRPVAPNARPDGTDDPVGRQQNRRVEIVVTARR